MLQALEPAALELSLQVAADVEVERQRLQQQWQQRLERVRYEAERACRQYNAVEPENRFVARTLERQWEAALAAEATVQAEYARFLAQQPVPLSAQEREAIRLSSSRLNYWLPWCEAYPDVVQGTAEFHHQITDALLPQAHPVFHDATALDTAVDVLDP